MKYIPSIKRFTSTAVLAGFVSAFALALASPTVNAIPYSGTTTPGTATPTFNTYTGVPSVGDESDFLRGRVEGSTTYVNDLSDACNAGTRYTLRVYVHNAADQANNNGGNGPSVAKNTQVKVALPANTTASSFALNSTISSSNAGTVNDGMTISCGGKTVKLSYVTGSAKQFTNAGGTQALNDSIVTTGAPIGTQSPNGDVWGCWDQRVYVALTLEVTEAPTPVSAVCEIFTIKTSDNRKVIADQFKTAQSGATFKSVVINWGDNTTSTVTDASKVNGTTHQYAQNGTYSITAVATFSVPGSADITSGGAGTPCAQQVTFSEKPPVVVTSTSTRPTALPNAGAGDVAALFAFATLGGAISYRWFLSRKLAQ